VSARDFEVGGTVECAASALVGSVQVGGYACAGVLSVPGAGEPGDGCAGNGPVAAL